MGGHWWAESLYGKGFLFFRTCAAHPWSHLRDCGDRRNGHVKRGRGVKRDWGVKRDIYVGRGKVVKRGMGVKRGRDGGKGESLGGEDDDGDDDEGGQRQAPRERCHEPEGHQRLRQQRTG